MKQRLSTFFALVCFAVLIFCLGLSTVGGVSSSTLYGKVIRLHVLANSDSEKDIELKYKVRDGILAVTNDMFSQCSTVDSALCAVNANKDVIENAAKSVLERENSDYGVSISIGKETYPQKKYGSLTFPKGEYLSVRVIIGEGSGENWWCVLFPPLCNAGIEDGSRVLVSYGIDEKQVEKLEMEEEKGSVEIFGCRIKLRILEYFE